MPHNPTKLDLADVLGMPKNSVSMCTGSLGAWRAINTKESFSRTYGTRQARARGTPALVVGKGIPKGVEIELMNGT
jgi:hypothetical protein